MTLLNDPNKLQPMSELVLLIQLLERINTNIDTLKGLQQTANSTSALVIEQLLTIRGEMKEWQKDTLETRAQRSNIEIQSLEAKDREYAIEMQKLAKSQDDVRAALENMKNGRGQTQEKMKAIATEVLTADKVDIRGVKLSRSQFTYVLIGVIILLAMLIVFLPDVVSQILMRLAGTIGGGAVGNG
ncbi:MAG: hypothetical protein M3R47_03030 [Chloroflexota bacterium]|nr:hypothetical protein [Chloroflexota bacterium]